MVKPIEQSSLGLFLDIVKPHRLYPLEAVPDCRTVTFLRSKDMRLRRFQMPEESSSFKLQSPITVQDETEAEECQGILLDPSFLIP